MKKWIVASVLSALVALPAVAALKEGDRAPAFQLQASLGGKAFQYTLTDALKQGPVVVYFFPSAYGGGCSVQARAFADQHEQFVKSGVTILGVSQDSIARLNRFSEDPEYCAGKVAVASDVGGKVSSAFALSVNDARPGSKDVKGQASDHKRVERTTFVISPDGRIHATVSGLAPAANVSKTLEIVQGLAAGKAVTKL